jgi:hypothetical protein
MSPLLLGLNIVLSTPYSNTSAYILPLLWETKFYTHVQQEAKFTAERYNNDTDFLYGQLVFSDF